MTAVDVYSQYVIRLRRAALEYWETQRSELQSACDRLDKKLNEAAGNSDHQVRTVEAEIEQLEEQLAGLRVTLQSETFDLMEKCENQQKRNEALNLRGILVSARWLIPDDELVQRSPIELKRFLADRGGNIEMLRQEMSKSLADAAAVIHSHPGAVEKAAELVSKIETIDDEIKRIRNDITRNYEVESAVLESLLPVETSSSSRLREWIKQHRDDAEIERGWGIPEQVFSLLG